MRGTPEDIFNPFKSNKDQNTATKLAIVRQVARTLVKLVDELRQPLNNSRRHDLYLKATDYLNHLEDEEIMEFINERSDWEKQ